MGRLRGRRNAAVALDRDPLPAKADDARVGAQPLARLKRVTEAAVGALRPRLRERLVQPVQQHALGDRVTQELDPQRGQGRRRQQLSAARQADAGQRDGGLQRRFPAVVPFPRAFEHHPQEVLGVGWARRQLDQRRDLDLLPRLQVQPHPELRRLVRVGAGIETQDEPVARETRLKLAAGVDGHRALFLNPPATTLLQPAIGGADPVKGWGRGGWDGGCQEHRFPRVGKTDVGVCSRRHSVVRAWDPCPAPVHVLFIGLFLLLQDRRRPECSRRGCRVRREQPFPFI